MMATSDDNAVERADTPLSMTRLWVAGLLGHEVVALGAVLIAASPVARVYISPELFHRGVLAYLIAPPIACGAYALLHWVWPRVTGWELDRRLAKLHFWMSVLFFNAWAAPLLLTAMNAGEPVAWIDKVQSLARAGLLFFQLPIVWAMIDGFFRDSRTQTEDEMVSEPANRSMPHSA